MLTLRWLAMSMLIGLATTVLPDCPTASAATTMTAYSCQGAILGLRQLGDQRLAVYQDGHGHRLELWCTRRIFDSQFDLRIVVPAPAHSDHDPRTAVAADRLATIGGCFFVNGHNQGPIFIRNPGGAYAKVEWLTANPNDRRQYRFSYDVATALVSITASVSGCAPVTRIVAPQPSYSRMDDLLPHPETQACALAAMGLNPTAPSP